MKTTIYLLTFTILLTAPLLPKSKTLYIEPGDIKVDKKAGKVLVKPDRKVRRSRYHTYIFDRKEFALKVGRVKSAKKIKIEIIKTRKERSKLDPNMPQPMGGFTYYYHESRITWPEKAAGRAASSADSSKKEDIADCLEANEAGVEEVGSDKVKAWCNCMYDKWPDDSIFETIDDFESNSPEGQQADKKCSTEVGW